MARTLLITDTNYVKKALTKTPPDSSAKIDLVVTLAMLLDRNAEEVAVTYDQAVEARKKVFQEITFKGE